MPTLDAKSARSKLDRLIEDTSTSHSPVLITGRRFNAVLVSEEDWQSIQETMYLLSVPGMRKSIRDGLKTPVNKCLKTLKW
jgi:prevent-host-death family protein